MNRIQMIIQQGLADCAAEALRTYTASISKNEQEKNDGVLMKALECLDDIVSRYDALIDPNPEQIPEPELV